ncbi:MAG: hypothetical protein ACXVMS_16635 [Flavisolibacter sp.]
MPYRTFMQSDRKNIGKILAARAVYLVSRQEPKFFIDLYQLENFYVEVFYHRKNQNQLYVQAFTEVEKLQPYLQHIEISSLLR